MRKCMQKLKHMRTCTDVHKAVLPKTADTHFLGQSGNEDDRKFAHGAEHSGMQNQAKGFAGAQKVRNTRIVDYQHAREACTQVEM